MWCRVWDEDESSKGYVIAYLDIEELLYGVADGSAWQHAEPIPQPERRLKRASEIIAECERRGWVLYHSGWTGKEKGEGYICLDMLADCGKSESKYNWPNWAWTEEI